MNLLNTSNLSTKVGDISICFVPSLDQEGESELTGLLSITHIVMKLPIGNYYLPTN